ncbi:hydroxylysine kinase /5-phosphonooxy-L-lysine phospho-lyase apoenzyme [Salegentibacter holothuriorum]|uniref:Hydroxylysine kinase /5-phosphonooxy-L-lysine phospho-lyase apoenzyme n=1 Tax=Salegentibacter holothuriorum TaxID=241145 RepID=A0A1T5E8T9_9FLAO|nr:aminotransferase class III-fold pyridoxal phosphate-dependent enzyme [Salegentibacter holothuriorum]SKB80209.1 hydroxylysine kinase /5-phosphonooxy-L-lysine phospho-lyase apoenzyme [Salegentibacter holothuriorum]
MEKLSLDSVKEIVHSLYNITGTITPLPGELDLNFSVKTNAGDYILKMASREKCKLNFLKFQNNILKHLKGGDTGLILPQTIPSIKENLITELEIEGKNFYIRLLTWIPGQLWSENSFFTTGLLFELGVKAGKLTQHLKNFEDTYPLQRKFHWDISQTSWTKEYQHLFDSEKKKYIKYFYDGFESIENQLAKCRKSIVHNDINDRNIIVQLNSEKVIGLIDFGDATYTATINDLAVCITYAMMEKKQVLEAAIEVIKGYHASFPLKKEELEILYWLVGARLIISLTKAQLNAQNEPENEYHQISAAGGWELIKKWHRISPDFARILFQNTCGYKEKKKVLLFKEYSQASNYHLSDLIETKKTASFQPLNLDISSNSISNMEDVRTREKMANRIQALWLEENEKIFFGGYNEVRPELINEKNRITTLNGDFWKNLFLGIQFWYFKKFKLRALIPGKIIELDETEKILIIEHPFDNKEKFYSIYRNLKIESSKEVDQEIDKGSLLGTHKPTEKNAFCFQLSLLSPQMLPPVSNCLQREKEVYNQIFPNPLALFKEVKIAENRLDSETLISERKTYLGKSLSLSYKDPLKIVRGDGAYLIDDKGRKYLDMVNNVAHLGHEHKKVVDAGKKQMEMLNTNSRYLHENILLFAKNLLATFPKELSVVHFVNSGSEANELAIRMAKSHTGQKDFIAVEVGYHGNTNACIDISSYKFDGKGGKGAPEHTQIVPLPDAFRGKYRGHQSGPRYAAHIQDAIKSIYKKNRKPAAFICESIISCGGQIELPQDYLKLAYQYTRKAGGVCIADEVQVGCGRLGTNFWGFQEHAVIPDIVTIGKPLGNGHPLAAVVCTPEIANTFANGMEYFNTFGGNPVSCAIGKKVLEVIKEENLQENALEIGNYLKEQLKTLQNQFPVIGDVRGKGLFLGFELNDKNKNPLTNAASLLVNKMKARGVLMSTDGPDNNVLKLKPPIIINRNQVDYFIYHLKTVLQTSNLNTSKI